MVRVERGDGKIEVHVVVEVSECRVDVAFVIDQSSCCPFLGEREVRRPLIDRQSAYVAEGLVARVRDVC